MMSTTPGDGEPPVTAGNAFKRVRDDPRVRGPVSVDLPKDAGDDVSQEENDRKDMQSLHRQIHRPNLRLDSCPGEEVRRAQTLRMYEMVGCTSNADGWLRTLQWYASAASNP